MQTHLTTATQKKQISHLKTMYSFGTNQMWWVHRDLITTIENWDQYIIGTWNKFDEIIHRGKKSYSIKGIYLFFLNSYANAPLWCIASSGVWYNFQYSQYSCVGTWYLCVILGWVGCFVYFFPPIFPFPFNGEHKTFGFFSFDQNTLVKYNFI